MNITHPARLGLHRLVVAVGLALLTVVLIAPPTSAALLDEPADAGAAWLADQVTDNGWLEGFTPGAADWGSTLQAVIALAAVGSQGDAASTMLDAANAELETVVAPYGSDDAGRLALLILANVALGRDPAAVSGVDLVARLQASQRPAGDPDAGLYGASDPSFDGAFRQGLSLLALASVGIDDPLGGLWLLGQQCSSGAWVAYRADTSSPCPPVDTTAYTGPDTNSTALALMGLVAQGTTPTADAVAWLDSVRTTEGGWAYFGDASQNADASSTGLVLAALRTATGSPDTQGTSALLGFQLTCDTTLSDAVGGFVFQPSADETTLPDVFSTNQALWGLSGASFPVVDAEFRSVVAPACAVDTATTTTTTSTTTTSTTLAPSATTSSGGSATPAGVSDADAAPSAANTAAGGETTSGDQVLALARTGRASRPLALLATMLVLAGCAALATERRMRR